MSNSDEYLAVFALLDEPMITIDRAMIRAVGGINEALFVQTMMRSGRQEEGGWLCLTSDEITERTTLTEKQQLTTRRNLMRMGVLEEQRIGLPARMHYKIDRDVVQDLLARDKERRMTELTDDR